jgi:hypothetical protein
MLAVPGRIAARLPRLIKHDVAEIDAEVGHVLGEIGGANGADDSARAIRSEEA